MSWLFELHKTQPIAHAVGVLAFVCVVGMALGSVKVKGVGLGTFERIPIERLDLMSADLMKHAPRAAAPATPNAPVATAGPAVAR